MSDPTEPRPDQPRLIRQGVNGRFEPAPPKPRSWPQAYRSYRASNMERRLSLLLAKLCAVFFGINLADEPILIFGQLDDPLGPFQFLGIVLFGGFTAWRVNKYRKNGY